VYAKFETGVAVKGESFKLKNRLVKKIIDVVDKLSNDNKGFRIDRSTLKINRQEYAIKDGFARDYLKENSKFENEKASMDKSKPKDASGYEGELGEIDWKTPEFADAYVRMPITFLTGMKMFNDNMASHVKAIRQIGEAAEGINKALKPKRQRFRTSLENSATVRGTR